MPPSRSTLLLRRSVRDILRRSLEFVRRSDAVSVTGHSYLQDLQHHQRVASPPVIVCWSATFPSISQRRHRSGTRRRSVIGGLSRGGGVLTQHGACPGLINLPATNQKTPKTRYGLVDRIIPDSAYGSAPWRLGLSRTIGTPIASVLTLEMRVRLTRKLAEVIDGVDLSGHTVGDAFDLPRRDARLLIAEGWAQRDRRGHGPSVVIAFRRATDPGPFHRDEDELSRAS
jgi:hypothetical protein